MRITISGTPGAGKSTTARMLGERLGYPAINAGQIFRDAATERDMSLEAFGAYVDTHPEIDRELDAQLVGAGREQEDVILEGRLAGWMTKNAGIPAFRIWMTADEKTRLQRIQRRDGGKITEVRKRLQNREKSERDRYISVYGLDLSDLSPYDLNVQTDTRTPEENVAFILEAIDTANGQRRT
ncbi:MAG: (d)CMP kinase [Candidatus Uhrbacteria bacterium]